MQLIALLELIEIQPVGKSTVKNRYFLISGILKTVCKIFVQGKEN